MHDALARLLIRYSTAVRPGEVVSLVGPPEAEQLVRALAREVLAAGGQPIALLQPAGWDDLLCRFGNVQQLSFLDPLQVREVEVADVAVHLLTAPIVESSADPSPMSLLLQSRRPLAERFLQRAAQGTLRWTAALVPSGSPEEYDAPDYEHCLRRAMLLDQPDPAAAWQGAGARQARVIDCLERCRQLRFTTPAGTDLQLDIAGCRWSNGAGQLNMPDGEVFTVPVPGSGDGPARFDFPVFIAGRRVEGIRLVFRCGQVVDATARRNEPLLRAMLEQDNARSIGEIGLGCNYAIDRPFGHPLADEKIGGTVHLALGKPGSPLHLDLVGDLRSGGRIVADGRTISDCGRFLFPGWPGNE